jgi:uncharacterized protein
MSAPGVIIEEKGFPTVSVHQSPTVPLFIGFFHNTDGVRLPLTTGCIEIKDSNDLRKKFPNSLNIKVEIENTEDGPAAKVKETRPGEEHGQSAFAIQHYFENGGGLASSCPLQAVMMSVSSST